MYYLLKMGSFHFDIALTLLMISFSLILMGYITKYSSSVFKWEEARGWRLFHLFEEHSSQVYFKNK